MNANEDPALQFFPDGKVDLYGVLGVEEKATEDEIKKQYRKLALRYHPDKVLSLNKLNAAAGSSSSAAAANGTAAPTTAEEASRRFQQLGFAYAVLSQTNRRERYDRTGRTDELGLGEDGEDFDWNEYFKTLWTGEVTGKTLDEFKKKYQGSEEEVEDIRDAYEEIGGNFGKLFEHVPCSEILADSERFIAIVEREITAKKLTRTKEWDRSVKDKSGRASLEKRARKEASEAEEYARELGVWDDLFGSKKGGSKTKEGTGKQRAAAGTTEAEEVDDEGNVVAAGDDDEDVEDDDGEEEDATEGRGKGQSRRAAGSKSGHGSSKSASSSKSRSKAEPKAARKGKKASAAEDGDEGEADDDLEGLKALMAKRNAQRESAFGSMLARMENQARGSKRSAAAAAAAEAGDAGSGEPTEEEFAALQAKLFGGGKGAGESSASGGGGKKKRKSR